MAHIYAFADRDLSFWPRGKSLYVKILFNYNIIKIKYYKNTCKYTEKYYTINLKKLRTTVAIISF